MKLHHMALLVGVAMTTVAMAPLEAPPVVPVGSAYGDATLLEVAIQGGRQTAVVLAIDGDQDGHVDQVFRLQVLGASADIADPVTFRNAAVSWDRDQVTVHSQAGGVLLAISDLAEANDPSVRTIHGFGLSHSTGWDLQLDQDDLVSSVQAVFDSSGECHCTAGGPGAYACGYTCNQKSCEVSCTSPNEPCCGCGPGGPCCVCLAPS
jgi:hypothetical protein